MPIPHGWKSFPPLHQTSYMKKSKEIPSHVLIKTDGKWRAEWSLLIGRRLFLEERQYKYCLGSDVNRQEHFILNDPFFVHYNLRLWETSKAGSVIPSLTLIFHIMSSSYLNPYVETIIDIVYYYLLYHVRTCWHQLYRRISI